MNTFMIKDGALAYVVSESGALVPCKVQEVLGSQQIVVEITGTSYVDDLFKYDIRYYDLESTHPYDDSLLYSPKVISRNSVKVSSGGLQYGGTLYGETFTLVTPFARADNPLASDYYQVQCGRGDGRYNKRYATDTLGRANFMYNCLNIGNGFKKRLVSPKGNILARQFS